MGSLGSVILAPSAIFPQEPAARDDDVHPGAGISIDVDPNAFASIDSKRQPQQQLPQRHGRGRGFAGTVAFPAFQAAAPQVSTCPRRFVIHCMPTAPYIDGLIKYITFATLSV